MEKTPSNARERNNAILRAIALLLIAMIFSGFGVALFKTENFFEKVEDAEACKLTRDTLNHLNALAALLPELEKKYDTIIALDQEWEREQSASAKAGHRTKIRQIENEMLSQLPQLKKEEFGILGERVFYAYNNLLTARTQLWDLRDERIDPPDYPCADLIRQFEGKLQNKKIDARDIALRIDTEKKELEKIRVSPVLPQKKKIDQILDGVTSNLNNMANELRGF